MKAIVYEKYGPPDVLELSEIEKPTLVVPRWTDRTAMSYIPGVRLCDRRYTKINKQDRC